MSQNEVCTDHRNKIISNSILLSIIFLIIIGSHFLIPSVTQNLIKNNIYSICTNDGFASQNVNSYSQIGNVYTLNNENDEVFFQIPVENITTFDLFVYLYISIDSYTNENINLKVYRSSDTFDINDKNSFVKTPIEGVISVKDPYFELNTNAITSEEWSIDGFIYLIVTFDGEYEGQVLINSIRRDLDDDITRTSITSKSLKSYPTPTEIQTILYAIYIIGGLVSIIFIYGIISSTSSYREELCHENIIEEKHRF